MAALRLNKVNLSLKYILCGNKYAQFREKSSEILTTPVGSLGYVEKVVTTNDCTTFVAWHPAQDFPYEHSLPLPPPSIPTSTLLKDEAIQTAMQAFGNKHPEIAKQELMKLTNTSIHTWKPRQREKRYHIKNTPIDREYL